MPKKNPIKPGDLLQLSTSRLSISTIALDCVYTYIGTSKRAKMSGVYQEHDVLAPSGKIETYDQYIFQGYFRRFGEADSDLPLEI